MTFETEEKARAASWRRSSRTLPADAKIPAPYVDKHGRTGDRPYGFCLPPQYATLSLLDEVRDMALALFAELGIPWHAGIDGGPSNHLNSSQVQCVNALGQMVADSSRIVRAFGDLLGIDEVLEIEPGRYLTFEYIGPTDYFDEAPRGARVRGARCTSVDGAFKHRAEDGVVELVLIEWKYLERYVKRPVDNRKNATRRQRYATALASADGPVRDDLLTFDQLTDEPFYQLMRQQLLAHALQTAGAEGASRVKVLHVSSPGNLAYQHSICRPEVLDHGSTVAEIWQKLLRHTDRFLSVDSSRFLDPAITSDEYARRYGEPLLHDLAEVLAHFEIDDVRVLEDEYDLEADITADADGLELCWGRTGTRVEYPFTASEFESVMREVCETT